MSIPTVCVGLSRYGRMGLLPGRSTLLRVGMPMGIESLVGAAAGGAFAGSTTAELPEASAWYYPDRHGAEGVLASRSEGMIRCRGSLRAPEAI